MQRNTTRTRTDQLKEKDEPSYLLDQANSSYLHSETESGLTNSSSQHMRSDDMLRDDPDETTRGVDGAVVAGASVSIGAAAAVYPAEAGEVEETEPWLQERARMKSGEFLDTWLDLEKKPALEKLRDIVQNFRDIAVYLHKSPKAKKRLENIQIERGREGRPAEPEDWFAVACLISLLDPIAAITEELSGGYPILSMTLPYLRYIKTQLDRTDLFEEDASLEGLHGYVNEMLSLMDSIRIAVLSLFVKRFENLPSEVLWISLARA
ncbi:hypothetical protein BBJ28_00001229 [Nothophytophthora sp. Chile5]|nr:hypothetical protein BBJ28_00001229 [Nothophytophthora sp. Chile5]